MIFMRASSNNYNFEGLLGLFKDDGTKASQDLYISGAGLRAGIFHDFTIDRARNLLYISWENQSDYNDKGPNITKIALDPETGLPAVPDDEGTVIDAEGVLSTILVSGTGRLYGRYEDRETKKFCYWDGEWHNNMTTDVLGGVLAAHPTMDYIFPCPARRCTVCAEQRRRFSRLQTLRPENLRGGTDTCIPASTNMTICAITSAWTIRW